MVLKKHLPDASQLTKALRTSVSDSGLGFKADRNASPSAPASGRSWITMGRAGSGVSQTPPPRGEGRRTRSSHAPLVHGHVQDQCAHRQGLRGSGTQGHAQGEVQHGGEGEERGAASAGRSEQEPQGKFADSGGNKSTKSTAPQQAQPVALTERKVNARADDHFLASWCSSRARPCR